MLRNDSILFLEGTQSLLTSYIKQIDCFQGLFKCLSDYDFISLDSIIQFPGQKIQKPL